jgi:hypothetical protein
VDGREILETYLNSAFKNISETVELFSHGTKSLLTSDIIKKLLSLLRDIILCAAVNIEILVKNLTMWMCHVT